MWDWKREIILVDDELSLSILIMRLRGEEKKFLSIVSKFLIFARLNIIIFVVSFSRAPPRRATPHVISKWKLIHGVSLKGSPSFLSFVSISFCAVLAFLLICPKYDLLRTVISEISLCSPVEINTLVRKKLFPSSFAMEIKMRDKRLKIDDEYFFLYMSLDEWNVNISQRVNEILTTL